MLNFIKKYFWDIILILVIAIGSTVAFFAINFSNSNEKLISYIYRQNELVEKIDLSSVNDESHYLEFEGYQSKMIIEYKHNAIRVKESGCPHQDCVDMGWTTNPNRPIICVYNQVSILFNSDLDVVIG